MTGWRMAVAGSLISHLRSAGEMAATFWMNVIKEPFIKSKYHPTTPTCPIRKAEKMDLNAPEFLTLIYSFR